MKKVLLISDTHSFLNQQIIKYIQQVDEVWHAGDVGKIDVIDEIEKLKTLKGVYGNIDNHEVRATLPEFLTLNVGKQKILMTHIGGKPYKYPAKVIDEINKQKPDIFICGHSHICKVEFDKKYNLLHLNPGACGIHGFHKIRTALILYFNEEKIYNIEVIEFGPRAKV